MTHRSSSLHGSRSARRSIPPLALGALALVLSACENDEDLPVGGTENDETAAGGQTDQSVQTVTAQPEPAGTQQAQQQTGGEQQQAAGEGSQEGAEAERGVEIGAFSPGDEQDGDGQGRLPAEGDLTIYVPTTNLFPGVAHLDPDIQNPVSGDPEAVAAGERHFNAFNCSGCHAPLAGGGMGPPLSDTEWIYGSEPAQVFLTIMHGRPAGMPAFGSMLPRRVVWELVAYIDTLDEIDDYAAVLGFDSAHATSVRPRDFGDIGSSEAQ